MGLEVQDKIQIKVARHSDLVSQAITNFAKYIQTETQALSLEITESVNEGVVLDMDEFELTVKVEKVN
jgi:isoleucyl-tRNA synthetase